MSDHDEHDALASKVRDAVAEAVRGTAWAPDAGILVDCVVMMGWVEPDGTTGTTHLRCGTPWSTLGLANYCVDNIEQRMTYENATRIEGDDE